MNRTSRHSLYILPCLALLLAALVVCVMAPGITLAAPNIQVIPTETLLVQFDANSTVEARDALIAEMGGELVTWMHQIHVAEIRVPVQAGVAAASLPALASDIVTFLESNAVVSLDYAPEYDPNDPDFSEEMMAYGLYQVQAVDAWDIMTGSQSVTIAVIDSGINFNHPEFSGRLAPGYDFVNDDELPEDLSGHGTHVSGVIAAALDNRQGVAGVCPNCRLMPVKVLGDSNLTSWPRLAQGIFFAVDNGARVINISLGTTLNSQTLASAIDYAVQSGVLVVAGAGNSASDKPFYPAAYDGVIAVSATTIQGQHWAKSNFGTYIDLSAPGELIYSTYHDLENLYRGYTYMSGTSMAASFVSGVAGILFSVEPDLTAQQVVEAMRLGADDLGPQGWDPEYGHGRVNLMGALSAPVPGLIEAVGEITYPRQETHLFLPALGSN